MPRQLRFKNTHENVRKTDANFLFVQHNSVPCVVSNESLCGLACTAMNELINSLGHLHIILNAWWRCIDLANFFWQRSRTSTTTINTRVDSRIFLLWHNWPQSTADDNGNTNRSMPFYTWDGVGIMTIHTCQSWEYFRRFDQLDQPLLLLSCSKLSTIHEHPSDSSNRSKSQLTIKKHIFSLQFHVPFYRDASINF